MFDLQKKCLTVLMISLKLLNDFDKQVVLRCPIIPGINDTEEHF